MRTTIASQIEKRRAASADPSTLLATTGGNAIAPDSGGLDEHRHVLGPRPAKGGVPVRYVNSTDNNKQATFEMKTLLNNNSINKASSKRRPPQPATGADSSFLRPSASASSDIHRPADEEILSDEGGIKVPHITVSDNEKETTSGQVTASEEDDYDEEAIQGGVQPASHAPSTVHHSELMPSYKMPSTDASSSRKSERSDERSVRSAMRADKYKEEKMPVSVGIVTVVGFIGGGAILFSIWEGWNLFDGAYYSFITLSTIGFGDIVPGKSLDDGSQDKLILCSLYLLFGMALIAMCFKLMQDDVVQKARWLGQKIGILVHEDSSDDESDIEEEDEMYEDEDEEVVSDG